MSEQPPTASDAYAQRLARLEQARWKVALDVQRPYRWNLRRLHLGRVLDVGCGIGRNLAGLGPDAVGVDHNAGSVLMARARGLRAYQSDDFLAEFKDQQGAFDSLLLAHVIEHMTPPEARDLLLGYLPFVRPGGTVVLICPQQRGFATDATHVTYFDAAAMAQLADSAGLTVQRRYSFPFPEPVGRFFAYNESCVVARVP